MFAIYATHADPENPLAALKIGERPEPNVPDGWTRVKISHASLKRRVGSNHRHAAYEVVQIPTNTRLFTKAKTA
jgi:hypothetical protein